MNYARRRIFTKVIKAFDRRTVQAYSNISDTYLMWSIQLHFKKSNLVFLIPDSFLKTKSSCLPPKVLEPQSVVMFEGCFFIVLTI